MKTKDVSKADCNGEGGVEGASWTRSGKQTEHRGGETQRGKLKNIWRLFKKKKEMVVIKTIIISESHIPTNQLDNQIE